MKKTILFLFVMRIMINLSAQFPVDGNYQTIMGTTPPLPSLYASVVDSTLPSPIEITRITDYVSDWNWYPHHEYAKTQPWNADASIYKFYSAAIYDAQTHQKITDLPGGELYPTYWSNTQPDILYGFKENGDIKTYSVSSGQINLIAHISDAQGNDYEMVELGPGEGNIDINDHYVALVGKQSADMDVIIFDLNLHQVVYRETFAGAWADGDWAPYYVDWVSISQSGDYVGIMWNHNTTSSANPFDGHYGVEIYNTADMQYLRRIAAYGNHGDFGFAQNGQEVFVQFWGPYGTVNMYYLDTLTNIVLSYNADFSGEGHISCRNILRPGWAYVSQDDDFNSGQMIAVKLDQSGIVEHFGHHFSTAVSYLKSPMPCPDPFGDKVMYKSDFGDNSPEVIYTFEARRYSPFLEINTKVLLEGPFRDTIMQANLDEIPLSQPFTSPPWNYQGNEQVAAIPNADVVDWVLIELRDAPAIDSATAQTSIAEKAAFLLKNGNVVGMDGVSLIQFQNIHFSQHLFLAVWHRNHLGIISANELVDTNELYAYDFSSALTQVYKGASGFKEIAPGIFGMIAGDANADGTIDFEDYNLWKVDAGNKAYKATDFDLNMQIDNQDKNKAWVNNHLKSSQVPE